VSVVANVAINVDSRNAVSKLRQVQSQSQATERAVGNLGAAVGKLAAALGVIQAARFVFIKTAELESQTRSLQVLTGSAEKAGQIIKDLQRLGAVTPFTSSELIDSAKRLQAFGVETNKVVETTRRLADVSGATGAELQGLVTAYGQVQAKGRLQGEELLQFQERGVALQQELRKQYNLSGKEFQDALQKGKISAEAIEFAIQKLTETGGKYANGAIAQSDTLSGRLSTLQDGVEALARRIGQVLTPALKAIFNQAIAVVDAINAAIAAGRGGGFTRNVAGARQFLNIGATSQAIQNIEKGIGQVSPQKNKAGIEQNLQALQQYQRLLQSIGPNDPNASRAVQLQGIILQKINQNIEAQKQLQAGAQQTQKLFTPPPLGAGESEGADKKKKDKAAEEEARLQARIRGLQIETEAAKQLSLIRGKITQAEIAGDKQLAARLQGEERNQQILIEYQKSLEGVTDEREQQALLAKALADIDAAGIETAIDLEKQRLEVIKEQNAELFKRAGLQAQDKLPEGAGAFDPSLPDLRVSPAEQQIAKYRQELEELTKSINIAITGADAIGDAFGQAFADIATGAKSTQQALADAFKSIGQAFIQMATQIIAKQIAMITFQTILKALGGGESFSFSGDGPYQLPGGDGFMEGFTGANVFAEGGFVTGPTRALIGEGGEPEYVIPQSKMSAAMSRYSRGARGESVIPGNGTSTEGGGAATATMQPIDVRYSVERINQVDYVTADQFQTGMRQAAAQGAKQGEQRALNSLRQNTTTRRKVGI